ncbi:polyadenylate-binding protein-interacting protein 1 [Notolabrus celidotus]|uniref:polyadenylate-binding protein-interacting protein 1 n=1 Tax=Notolabrus celidotus TaxID=1203425 RepID=UPI00148F488B|nr:polyadenylate-binding protein-interacting protein 1 [Notolabrus celidotus]XP_034547839.1 polyadenylate-binding protein-interacting protein 1 [Notolabrus celidotus]XP_034547840.1 polyadenylate-binding protein-interacting protein 1 [Notolabrus celidotus]
MNENFDRTPGAGRSRNLPGEPGFVGSAVDGETRTTLFNQREPLRQPRTCPPFAENNSSSTNDVGDLKRQNKPQQHSNANSTSASRRCNDVDSLALSSTLSANAPEFVPSGFGPFDEDPAFYDDSQSYVEPTLDDMVTEFLGHLSSSPGSFESDVEQITGMLNAWVTTEESLHELVELIYTQSTAIPNFSYTGARLCNYLSHHLNISPPSGNFRQLLLKRCRTEFEQRDAAVQGDTETQKKFHSFVLFLGELYLNLEVKGGKGKRADILLSALNDLMKSLFDKPVDANLICAVKLLKLTGSVLDDAWKESGKQHMEELIRKIENVLLDATCSRDVRQMLLKLVELRSSDWGRVRSAAAASNATPDNDPNYFMNEPTFYTEDGTPFTAADPEYAEKYQEIMERQDYFHDMYGENGNELSEDSDDEMGPEIEEAFESFYLESERKRKQ